jgi:hypothetical protein
MEFISDSIANYQLETSITLIVSLYIVGSLASMKKRPREYLVSSLYNSLSDRYAMTGLASSSVIVLRTFELGGVKLTSWVVLGNLEE